MKKAGLEMRECARERIRLIRSTVVLVTQSGSTNPRRYGESRTERTIGMKPIMGGLVRMMEEKAENLHLEPFVKKLKRE